jgi:HD-GYP domain-containing protein (c-di-GMP phosphodiesterase class II)
MHLSETEIKKLKEAGFLHDIGKIILDKALLNKEGELSPQEKQEMMQHPVVGYRILNLFDHTVNVADGVFGHHERWDGSGYPKGLKGEEIPRMARILAVAEYYEAMLNDRIKKDIGKQEALQEIQKQANVKFDPEIVDIFVKRMSGDL